MDNNYNSENLIKIDKKHLEKINNNKEIFNIFGSWVNNIEELQYKFLNAEPFENVVIDNFLNNEYAEKLYQLFPNNYEDWYKYINPIEVKYAYDNINNLPLDLKNYFYYLSTNFIIEKICKLTNIQDLEYDEYLHGGGLHCHPKNGRLNIHLDYEKHPYSGKERRINIIYFLSKDWINEWNGCNELWDKDVTKCVQKTDIKFNRAIIFKTNDVSWHGLPEKINCPENIFRKSLAYYYVSPINSIKTEEKYRKKAKYTKRPQDPYNENMEKLYKIRSLRRITQDDLKNLFPNWNIDH